MNRLQHKSGWSEKAVLFLKHLKRYVKGANKFYVVKRTLLKSESRQYEALWCKQAGMFQESHVCPVSKVKYDNRNVI